MRFLLEGREINTKSFPFSFELRKEMAEATFGNRVTVLPDYTFHAPYSKYLPPLFSRRSWQLRAEIVSQIKEGSYVSYTGDAAERLMLRLYRLNPLKASRHEISASAVKEMMYQQILDGSAAGSWAAKVPTPVVEIIRDNWNVVERFARSEDLTTRVLGMKFPQEGFK